MRRLSPLIPLLFAVALAACGSTGNQLSSADPSANVGRAALNGGAPEAALQVAGNLLTRRPADPEALLLRADALATMNRGEEAVAAYQAALAVTPRSAEARLGLGRLLMSVDAAAAEAQFLQALTLNPRSAAAANNLGIARDLQNRHAEAQLAYRQALASQPTMQAAAVNLALSLGLSGRAAEAIPILRPIAQSPGATPRIRHDMAAILAMSGDRNGAANMLQADLSDEEVDRALKVFTGLSRE